MAETVQNTGLVIFLSWTNGGNLYHGWNIRDVFNPCEKLELIRNMFTWNIFHIVIRPVLTLLISNRASPS